MKKNRCDKTSQCRAGEVDTVQSTDNIAVPCKQNSKHLADKIKRKNEKTRKYGCLDGVYPVDYVLVGDGKEGYKPAE